MLKTLEATIDPEGRIRFREKIRLTRSQRVLVTLLDEENAPAGDDEGGVARMLALLSAPDFRARPFGSAAELEAMVEQNRSTAAKTVTGSPNAPAFPAASARAGHAPKQSRTYARPSPSTLKRSKPTACRCRKDGRKPGPG